MEFKIEIEGKREGKFLHVNVVDNLYVGEKRRRFAFYAGI